MKIKLASILLLLCLLLTCVSCNKYGIKNEHSELVLSDSICQEIILNVGDTLTDSYIMYKGLVDFTKNDIVLTSSNPIVATVEITSEEFPIYTYFNITAHSPGVALINAETADGSVKAEQIKVIVFPKADSDNSLESDSDSLENTDNNSPSQDKTTNNNTMYVLNKNSKKFHIPTCTFVSRIKDENKDVYTGSREDLITDGYSGCKTCKS